MHPDEGIYDERIVHRSKALEKYLDCLIARQLWSIGTVRSQSIEAIHHRKNPSTNWYFGASKTTRIPSSVPTLMVVTNDRDDGIREINGRQNVGANTCVQFHF